MLEHAAEVYDGTAPFAGEPGTRTTGRRAARATGRRVQVAVTAAIAGVPFAGLILAPWLVWGHGVGLADALLMAGFYVITGLVRVTLLRHVTWSVNPLCHLLGTRPFAPRRFDRATNLWPLALLSFGESWHNLHHSDPACARHGVDKLQIDLSAGVIRIFERLGWATNVRWPSSGRLDRRRRSGGDRQDPALVAAGPRF